MSVHYLDQLLNSAKVARISPRDYYVGSVRFNDKGEPGSEESNDAVFLKMRSEWIADGRDAVQIELHGGDWLYSNNTFLHGVASKRLDLGGGSMYFVDPKIAGVVSSSVVTRTPLASIDPWRALDDHPHAADQSSRRTYIDGHRIQTVAAGQTSIELDEGDGSAYADASPDNPVPVFLECWDVQPDGYPPNFLYYEWNDVIGRSGTTLTLRTRTKYRYASTVPDRSLDGIDVGAARIRRLTGRTSDRRWNDMARSIEIVNGSFFGDPATHRLGVFAIDRVIIKLRACNLPIYGYASRFFWSDVNTTHDLEGDKAIDRSLVQGRYRAIGGFTGCKVLELLNPEAFERISSGADITNISGGVTGPRSSAVASVPVSLNGRVNVRGHIAHTAGGDGAWLRQRGDFWATTITLDSVSGDDSTFLGEVDLRPGYLVRISDGTLHGWVYDFTGITEDPDTRTYKVHWSAPPSLSDTFHFYPDYEHVFDNISGNESRYLGIIPNPRTGVYEFEGPPPAGNFSIERFICPSRLFRITVDVIEASTGVGKLLIRGPSPDLKLFANIDLSEIGTRVIEAGKASTGAAGNDVLNDYPSESTHADMSTWFPVIRIETQDVAADRTGRALFRVKLECVPLKTGRR